MICFCKSEMEIITINKNGFYRCPNCHYLKKINTVSLEKEKARYDMHVVDSSYEQYMKGVYDEIKPYINGDCIDYGCGKKHILADIICENGLNCDYYDYFYFKELNFKKYDTIILIEVFEHINDLLGLFSKLNSMLKSSGRIIIKTKVIPELNKDFFDDLGMEGITDNEIILILGKGNEKYQLIKDEEIFYEGDKEVVLDYIKNDYRR